MATATDESLTERYQVKKHLGSGGNGDAYLAWDTSLRREIVIKRVRAGELGGEVTREIMDEAARMAAIRHPNIVSIHDISLIDGAPCIIMEFVQGQTVEERVHTGGAFTIEAFVDLARQTLDALAAAHQAGLIHRDVKPTNIMLIDLPSGLFQSKVLDFGLAKFVNADAPSPQTVSIDGSIRGSVHYISPEQLNHESVDARSDLYSLGCTLYLALTSIEPFTGESVAGVIAGHLTHRVMVPSEVRPAVPRPVSDWLMKLMSRQPAERFQTAVEAMNALEEVAFKVGMASTTRSIRLDRKSATMQSAARNKIGLLAAICGLGLAIFLGAGIWLLFGQKNTVSESTTAEVPAVSLSTPIPEPTVVALPPEPAKKEPVVATPPVPSAVAAAPVTPAVQPPSETVEVIMQVAGSNTIGAKLMPRLVEGFLKHMKMTDLDTAEIKAEEVEVRFHSPLGEGRKAVAIKSHGSSTAFKELLAESSDIGMSSRPIKDEEAQSLAGIGDMKTSTCEHVVGLDGLAVVVNRANSVSQLTVQQVAALFAGEIKDWSEVGGAPGPVTLYARDDKSGTFDSFKSLVLDKKPLYSAAKRFEDSKELSEGVAADAGGIGFIGLPYVGSTKALALSDAGTAPMLPSPFTVATEDYVLSRRLFLYSPAVPRHPWTTNFIEFVLSDEGQSIVEKSGFISQEIDVENISASPEMPDGYRALITQGAGRLSLTFRFQPNKGDFDAKAVRDFDRVLRFLTKSENRTRKVHLLGFSDSSGQTATNLKLSKERVDVVARQLAMRGIQVTTTLALGEQMPVATNDTPGGREKNRRVEIWVQNSPTTLAGVPAGR